MKFKKIKLILVPIMICIVLISGCSSGLNIGFGGRGEFLFALECAVKSNRTDFDVNDVTLDFYYGGRASEYNDEMFYSMGIAIYLIPNSTNKAIINDTPYEDYRNIEGHHFVKLISVEEFNSGEYDVDVTLFKKTFKHHEPLTIPAEIFQLDDNEFNDYFNIKLGDMFIYKDKPDAYYFSDFGSLKIYYKFLNEHTVQLSKR